MTINKQVGREDPKVIMKNTLAKLGLPLFVKPICTGSSVGVKKVKKKEALAAGD